MLRMLVLLLLLVLFVLLALFAVFAGCQDSKRLLHTADRLINCVLKSDVSTAFGLHNVCLEQKDLAYSQVWTLTCMEHLNCRYELSAID